MDNDEPMNFRIEPGTHKLVPSYKCADEKLALKYNLEDLRSQVNSAGNHLQINHIHYGGLNDKEGYKIDYTVYTDQQLEQMMDKGEDTLDIYQTQASRLCLPRADVKNMQVQ